MKMCRVSYKIVMRWDVACTSGITVLPPSSSQPRILLKDLKIDILKLRGFHSMSKRKTTDASSGYDDFDRSWMIERKLGLFVRHRVFVFVGLSGLYWQQLAVFDPVG